MGALRRKLYVLMSIMICMFAVVATPVHTYAAETDSCYTSVDEGDLDDGYYVLKVSKSEINSMGANKAIQEALDIARTNATTKTPYKIVVQPGSYQLETALRIYSNTYLDVREVTFTQPVGDVANMLKIGDLDDTTKGYYYENIVVDGGTWNEKGNSNTAIKMCHAKNVTLKNATLMNCKNSHLMEIAGIDGITIEDCTFQDQKLDVDAEVYTYEAIQLDVLLESHLSGYRSEDLPLKNVKITGCTFTNVPRGLGSHTAILNNPVDTIEVTNNTFTGLKSLAIQAMNWVNCTISDNTITNTPQGIMVYSIRESGTFLASTVVKEGGVKSSTPTTYVKPSESNIEILNNKINVSGTDPYEEYENAAIFVSGYNISKAVQGSGDKIPAGNYYISNVTIKGNTVTTKGHGIRLQDVKTSTISNNTITYEGSASKVFYGIQIREGATNATITKNKINSPISGIHVFSNSSAKTISNNTIKTPKNNGIMVEDATATTITSNKVTSAGISGIFVYADAEVESITDNTITSPKSSGIDIDGSTVSTVTSNTFDSAKVNAVFVHNGGMATTISENDITNAGKNGIFIEKSTVTNIQKNNISKAKGDAIFVYAGAKVENITGNVITSPKSDGIDVDNATVKNITSNTVKDSSNYPINVHNKATIGTISKNKITAGKSNLNVDNSTVSTVTSNTFASATTNALFLHNGGTVTTFSKNKVTNAGKNGIFIENFTVKNLKNNEITNAKVNGILVYAKSKVTKIYGNTITNSGKYGIGVENATATTIQENKIVKPQNTGIFVLKNGKVSKIMDNTITSGKARGISINSIKCNMQISGNTIKSCKDYLIYCNPSSTKYEITISKNNLTGSKSIDGVRVDSGKVVISENTIKKCNRAVILSAKVVGEIHSNTFTGNTYNNAKVDKYYAANLKSTTVKVTSSKAKTVKVKWKKVADATGYIVYRSTSENGTYEQCAEIKKGSTVTYTDKKLTSGKTYYYKVVACQSVNGKNIMVYGELSDAVSVKVK